MKEKTHTNTQNWIGLIEHKANENKKGRLKETQEEKTDVRNTEERRKEQKIYIISEKEQVIISKSEVKGRYQKEKRAEIRMIRYNVCMNV